MQLISAGSPSHASVFVSMLLGTEPLRLEQSQQTKTPPKGRTTASILSHPRGVASSHRLPSRLTKNVGKHTREDPFEMAEKLG